MNDNNKILQQISSVFSIFMVIFYIGAGILFIFYFEQSIIDKATRILFGSALLIFGVFRIFKTFFQIKKLFFSTEEEDE